MEVVEVQGIENDAPGAALVFGPQVDDQRVGVVHELAFHLLRGDFMNFWRNDNCRR